jgi:hypothetical protein
MLEEFRAAAVANRTAAGQPLRGLGGLLRFVGRGAEDPGAGGICQVVANRGRVAEGSR